MQRPGARRRKPKRNLFTCPERWQRRKGPGRVQWGRVKSLHCNPGSLLTARTPTAQSCSRQKSSALTASQPMKRPVPAEKVGPVRRPANGRPAGEKAGWSVGHGDSRRAQGVTLVLRRRAGAEAGVSGGVSRARGREVSDAGSSGRHVGVVAQRLAGGDEWCSRDDQGDGSVGAWQRWQRWSLAALAALETTQSHRAAKRKTRRPGDTQS